MRRSVDALFVQRRLELVQPRRRHAVRGRAPVAAGAEAAAHRYLGGVGKGRTLELACLEEAEKEDLQPLADGGQVVGALQSFGIVDRPRTARSVVPGLPGQEGDFRRRLASPDRVEEAEIVQLIGADPVLRALHPLLSIARPPPPPTPRPTDNRPAG